MNAPVETRDPEASYASPDVKGMAAGVTVTAQISQTRSIVIQTYLDRDSDVKEFHGVLDKFAKAIERQEAKATIAEEATNLALEEKTLKQMLEDFSAIEDRSQKAWERANKKGSWKLSDVDATQKATATTNIERYRSAIATRKTRMAKLEALIAEGN